jgi:predicted secreted protein
MRPPAWLDQRVRSQPLLDDERGRRVVFLSHCLLNENTRYAGGAFTAGASDELVERWVRSGVGIVQMPCPEQRVWGGVLKRWLGVVTVIGRRSPRPLRRGLVGSAIVYTRVRYGRLAREVARQIIDYRRSGFEVVAVVGVDGSPSCGVFRRLDATKSAEIAMDAPAMDRTEFNRRAIAACVEDGAGWYTEAIQRRLRRRGCSVPFHSFDLLAEMNGDTIVHVAAPRRGGVPR